MIFSEPFEFEESDIVDFHSHILPGVDHGSDNLDCTLYQIKLAKSYSVKRIVATPHFYPSVHTLSNFLNLRDRAIQTLKQVADDTLPEIKVGAEVLLCEGLERFPNLDKLCFQNTKYIMLELPFMAFSEEYAISAGAIADMGYNVILAHADRYSKETVEIMLDYGVTSLQINVDSLVTMFRKKHILKWIEDGRVSMIGSDIHGTSKKYYKRFCQAQNKFSELFLPIKKASDKIWKEIEAI